MKIYRKFIYGANYLVIDGKWGRYTCSNMDEPFFDINLPDESVLITKFIIDSPHYRGMNEKVVKYE